MLRFFPYYQSYTALKGMLWALYFFAFLPFTLAQPTVYADSLLAILQTNPSPPKTAFLHNELAWYYHETDASKAKHHVNIALTTAQKHQLTTEIGDAYRTKGLIFRHLEMPSTSILYQDSAYHYYQVAKDTAGLLAIINNIGPSLVDMGHCEKAVEGYQRAEQWTKDQVDKTTWIMLRINHTMTLFDCQSYEAAIELCKEGIDVAFENDLIFYTVYFYGTLGGAYMELKQFEEALTQFNAYEKILEEIDDPQLISAFINNRALVYLEMGSYEQALEDFKRSDAIDRANDLNQNYAQSGINMGIAAYQLGRYELSAQYFSDAIPLLEAEEQLIYLSDAYLYASETQEKLGNFEEAYQLFKKSSIFQDSIFSKETRANLDALNTKYQTEIKERQLAEAQLALTQQKSKTNTILWICVGLVLVLGSLISYFWMRQKSKQLQVEKRKIELEYSLLRAQMNPHFIFNSLNSIQGFFSQNQFNLGNEFLGTFSTLIRRVLDQSASTYISLNEELETLQLYLQLEKTRLKNKLHYQFDIHEDIGIDLIQVPPLTFQPFVENAIWHGIAPKEEQGTIQLKVALSADENFLLCEILDDGVGLHSGFLPNAKKTSKGIQITRERLGKHGDVQLNPLFDHNNCPAGMQVYLKIPIFDYD